MRFRASHFAQWMENSTFHEYVVENLKYVEPGIFFSREISPVFAAILRRLWGCSFKGLNNPKIDVPPKNLLTIIEWE